MNRGAFLLVVVALLLAVAALVVALSRTTAPPVLFPAPPADPGAAAAVERRERAFRRLSTGVDALAARVADLETRAGSAPDVGAPQKPGSDSASRPEDAAPAELDDRSLSSETLFSLVRQLSQAHKEPAKRVALVDELLKRDLQPDLRGDALFEKGVALREEKKTGPAAQAFEEALRYMDSRTEAAGETTFQIAWEMQYLGKRDRAIELMRDLGANTSLSATLRDTARVRVVQFAAAAGDTALARSEAERLIAEHGSRDDEWAKREIPKCRAVLDSLSR